MARTHTVRCDECDRERESLIVKGFNVLGCVKDPSDPRFCIISYEDSMMLAGASAEATIADRPVERAAATRVAAPAEAAAAAEPLTPAQRAACEAIVNVFETGSVRGDYGQVTVIPTDTGRLTYGRSQAALGSGSLLKLLRTYCDAPRARFGERLRGELKRFESKDQALDTDQRLHNVLRACADDPVMRDAQDTYFDRFYFQPALRAANALGIVSALGVAVVYDSFVHGSWPTLRDRTNEVDGTVAQLGERAWVRAYVARRRLWLAASRRKDLRATTYRMDAFQRLLDQNQWGLALPLVVRGVEVSELSLAAVPRGCFDGPQPGSRPLLLASPLATGLDVRLLQLALSELQVAVTADGVFGKASANAIRAFQIAHGQEASGTADVAFIRKMVGP